VRGISPRMDRPRLRRNRERYVLTAARVSRVPTATPLPVPRPRGPMGVLYRSGARLADRLRRGAPWLTLLAVALVFRIPVLLNAGAVTSDGAVVGLQAMHMLRGEWSWSLWGAPYQAPADSVVAAALFAVFGARPLVLVLVPLLGHLGVVVLTYGALRTALRRWSAVVATLPIVVTPMAVNFILVHIVQRQACVTLFAVSVWLLATAPSSRHRALRIVLGAWTAFISAYLDLFAMQWVPCLALLTVASAWRRPLWRREGLLGLAAAAAGLLIGWLSFRTLSGLGPPDTGHLSIDLGRYRFNRDLLLETCLPWTLGYRVFVHRTELYPQLWTFPTWFRVVQYSGAVILGLSVVAGATWTLTRSATWQLRRLGWFGCALIVSSLGAFLVSVAPTDMWSTRYLAPMILAIPFALAPLARRLGTKRIMLLCAPYLVSAAANGWLSYGMNYLDGWTPARTARGSAWEEMQVARLLRSRGVEYAAAQYWLAYRLTFLFREHPIVVPLNEGQDRYPPYRQKFNQARDVAYVFHSSEPRASPVDQENNLRARHANFEKHAVAGFTVFIEHR
jgi:hypothetical protein